MPQSLSVVYLHLVFSTKNREPWLGDAAFRDEMHRVLGGISRELECAPVRVGGVADHVHILARFGRTVTIADWVKELKRGSNVWLKDRATGFENFEWQGGYAVFSVCESKLEATVEYIAGQEKHHAKLTFQDELRAFFKRHKVEFDERYVWD